MKKHKGKKFKVPSVGKINKVTLNGKELKLVETGKSLTYLDIETYGTIDIISNQIHRSIEESFLLPSSAMTSQIAAPSVITADSVRKAMDAMIKYTEALRWVDQELPTLPEDKPTKPEPETKFKSWPYVMDDE